MASTATDYVKGLLARQKESKALRCAVAKFLADPTVDQKVRDGIRAALDEPRIYGTTIAAEIGTHEKAVQRHRTKNCGCFKGGS